MNTASFDLSGLVDLIQKGGPPSRGKSVPGSVDKILSANGFASLKGDNSQVNIWEKLAQILNSDLPDPEKNQMLEALLSESPGAMEKLLGANADELQEEMVQVTGAFWPSPDSDEDLPGLDEQSEVAQAVVPPVLTDTETTPLTTGGLQKGGGGQSGENRLKFGLPREVTLPIEGEGKGASEFMNPHLQGEKSAATNDVMGALGRGQQAPDTKAAAADTVMPAVEKGFSEDKVTGEKLSIKPAAAAENATPPSMNAQSGGDETPLKDDSGRMFTANSRLVDAKAEMDAEKVRFKISEEGTDKNLTVANLASPEEQKSASSVSEEGNRSQPVNLSTRQVQNLASTSAPRSPEPVPEKFQTDIINQIVEKATLQRSKDQPEIRIKLKPEFLGNIKLNISATNQQVMVKVLTDLPAVKEILETNLAQLRSELQQHGLQVDKFDVQVGPDSGQNGQDRGQHANRNMHGRPGGETPGDDPRGKQSRDKERRPGSGRNASGIDYFA